MSHKTSKRKRRIIWWTTQADNLKTWEDFEATQRLLAKKEAIHGNEEESAIHDYAAHRAKVEVEHIQRRREGMRATLKSTHVPGVTALEPAVHYVAPASPADTKAVVERGREIMREDSDGDNSGGE